MTSYSSNFCFMDASRHRRIAAAPPSTPSNTPMLVGLIKQSNTRAELSCSALR